MVVPDRTARRELLRRTHMHMMRAIRARLSEDHVALGRVAKRLGDPRLVIAAHQQSLDDRETRLARWARGTLGKRRDALSGLQRRLAYLHPRAVLTRERAELVRASERLTRVWGRAQAARSADVQRAGARLDALSPLKVLARGYAIATRDDGAAVRSAADVRKGDAIHVRVRDARIEATVDAVAPVDDGTAER
jgi:exodeoxyribonuclease VII large subunit